MKLEKRLRKLDGRLAGELGLWACDLETGDSWGLREDDVFSTASVIKIQILAVFYAQIKARRLRPATPRNVRRTDMVDGSGVLKHFSPGTRLSLRDLAVLMTIVSDNTATNMIIDRLGIQRINDQLREWGFEKTTLWRKIAFDKLASTDPKWLGQTTPRETGELLALIAERKLLGKRYDTELEQILSWQKSDTGIGRRLPGAGLLDEDDAAPGVTVANKTGAVDHVRNDCGIVTAPFGRFVLSAFTRHLDDNRYHPDNEGMKCIARAARTVYDHLEQRTQEAAACDVANASSGKKKRKKKRKKGKDDDCGC